MSTVRAPEVPGQRERRGQNQPLLNPWQLLLSPSVFGPMIGE